MGFYISHGGIFREEDKSAKKHENFHVYSITIDEIICRSNLIITESQISKITWNIC